MKKLFLILCISAFGLTSCSTIYKSASNQNVNASLVAVTISDLDVSNQKITYTFTPTKNIRRGGLANCVNTAISEALANNGGGDILIETQDVIVKRSGFFGKKIKSVTVTGYPAKYKNFRSADDETIKTGMINGTLVKHVIKRK